MFHKNYPSNTLTKRLPVLLTTALAGALWLSSCSTTETRWDSPILVPPPDAQSQSAQTPATGPESMTPAGQPDELIQPVIERPYIQTADDVDRFQTAWRITRAYGLDLQNLEAKIDEYGVTQIHLGGDILQAVDDLILNPGKRDYVQRLAQRLDAKNVETLVCSHEIHLEGRTFLFNENAPLAAARQAAYRKALSLIPELDGVVLTFSNALLPPWDASLPPEYPQMSQPERIRFLVDLIRPVVVDELGKRLYIQLEGDSPQSSEWIVQALQSVMDDSIVAIVPSQTTPLQNALFQSFHDQPRIAELDLAGVQFGGPRFIVENWTDWPRWQSLRNQEDLEGVVSDIHGQNGSLLNSPNEINLFAFSKSGQDAPLDHTVLQADWIQKKLGLLPMSREGNVMSNLLANSFQWNAKMSFVQNMLCFSDNGGLPDPETWSLSQYLSSSQSMPQEQKYFLRRLLEPNKQMLIDMAQESAEAVGLLEQAIWDLESLQLQLDSMVYNDLHRRLEHQRFMADVLHYAKQVIWGFEYWKKTRDEDEALYLEAHLQKLERLADAMEERYPKDITPGNPDRIRSWVGRIRREFPRVILGWKERQWNQIKEVAIHQTGQNSVEIQWKSALPASAKVFAADQLPIFERMVSVSSYPITEHKARVENIEPGKIIYLKIQIQSEDGQITNSGVFPFQLESSPVM
ncbi:MAG: hypothetical protein JXR73_08930 [Candidatus Omnitrophica bacterium]|nr:hypothetical protein [Candidatus Omnitrophota bacterium]